MPILNIQSPLDQPKGNFRLLDDIKTNLSSTDFNSFKFITAFAKVGPLLRLEHVLKSWRKLGNTVEAIFGIDEQGTSLQALQFALQNFDRIYVARIGTGAFRPTFHPKIYSFEGAKRAITYIGSNNMTLGGTETNAESLVRMQLTLPADHQHLVEINRCWQDSLTVSLPLDKGLLAQLVTSTLVIDETAMFNRRLRMAQPLLGKAAVILAPVFPAFQPVPSSALPKKQQTIIKRPQKPSVQAPASLNLHKTAIAMQIIPHHNGEILLSKKAVNKNPSFFGFPFTGFTTPKKSTNSSYPQRIPDPVVDIQVFNLRGIAIVSVLKHQLNMVYYDKKGEIRITVPPQVRVNIPDYSMMVMRESGILGVDYELYIYPPGSQGFKTYIGMCKEMMPSGGKSISRRFGWI